ncbi:MAG: putative phage tail protein [Sphaerochaetaceae bacterium]
MTPAIDSPHFKALQKLKPVDTDEEDAAVALELDRVLAAMDSAYVESFPGTATDTLARWETLYGLDHSGPLTARRMALLAEINKDAGISAADYIALAKSLGFDVTIPDPPRMFRAGVSRAGQPVYDADEQYTWTVHVDAFEEAGAALVSAFEAQKIPFTIIRWIWRTPPLQMSMALETQATDPVETGVQIALDLETQATDPVGTSLQTTFALEDA